MCRFLCYMGPEVLLADLLYRPKNSLIRNRRPAGSRWLSGGGSFPVGFLYGLSEERRADFRREYLGFIFQQHHLMPYLNALENAMLPLVTSKTSAKEKRVRALAVLQRVGLADKSAPLPNQLSGGEQGRLAIARALVNEPPLILADEPTGTLDSKTGVEIMARNHLGCFGTVIERSCGRTEAN